MVNARIAWACILFLVSSCAREPVVDRSAPEKGVQILSVEDNADIVTALVLNLAPPAEFDESYPVSIFVEAERPLSAERFGALRRHYPLWLPLTSGVHHELDEATQCFRDPKRGMPALGIGIGTPVLRADGVVEVEAGSAMCVLGTRQSTYELRKSVGRWAVTKERLELII